MSDIIETLDKSYSAVKVKKVGAVKVDKDWLPCSKFYFNNTFIDLSKSSLFINIGFNTFSIVSSDSIQNIDFINKYSADKIQNIDYPAVSPELELGCSAGGCFGAKFYYYSYIFKFSLLYLSSLFNSKKKDIYFKKDSSIQSPLAVECIFRKLETIEKVKSKTILLLDIFNKFNKVQNYYISNTGCHYNLDKSVFVSKKHYSRFIKSFINISNQHFVDIFGRQDNSYCKKISCFEDLKNKYSVIHSKSDKVIEIRGFRGVSNSSDSRKQFEILKYIIEKTKTGGLNYRKIKEIKRAG